MRNAHLTMLGLGLLTCCDAHLPDGKYPCETSVTQCPDPEFHHCRPRQPGSTENYCFRELANIAIACPKRRDDAGSFCYDFESGLNALGDYGLRPSGASEPTLSSHGLGTSPKHSLHAEVPLGLQDSRVEFVIPRATRAQLDFDVELNDAIIHTDGLVIWFQARPRNAADEDYTQAVELRFEQSIAPGIPVFTVNGGAQSLDYGSNTPASALRALADLQTPTHVSLQIERSPTCKLRVAFDGAPAIDGDGARDCLWAWESTDSLTVELGPLILFGDPTETMSAYFDNIALQVEP